MTHTTLEIKPLAAPDVHGEHMSMDFDGVMVHIAADAPGLPQR